MDESQVFSICVLQGKFNIVPNIRRILMEFINIGFGNLVSLQRIVSVLNSDSSPVKRLVHLAKEKERLIDASCGRKTQSVLVMDTGHVVLSALSTDNVQNKIVKNVDTLN